MKRAYFICLFLLVIPSLIFSQDISKPIDLPRDHWAYSAVMKLIEDGIIEVPKDKKFKGDAPLTRYEAAVMLVKLLSRLESLETIISKIQTPTEPQKETLADTIKKLIKEFQGEIETVKKVDPDIEKKVAEALKKIADMSKEAKKERADLKKELSGIKRDITTLQRDFESTRDEQQRISFSGENYIRLENIDYGASGMGKDTQFTMREDDWGKTRGRPAPSYFSAYNSLLIKMKASPRLGIKTDKKIEVNANMRVNYRDFLYGRKGTGYEEKILIKEEGYFPIRYYSSPLYLESLNFNYSAPRAKFISFAGGYISAGWTILSLSMTGWNFYGFKASSIIGKNTADFVVANITGGELRGIKLSAESPSVGGTSISQKITYNETLYGMSILHSYGKANFMRISVLQNKQDRDSFAAREDVRKLYKPDTISILSIFTRAQVMKGLSFTGEIAFSDFTQYKYAPYYFKDTNNDKIWNPGEVKILDETTPTINTKDSAFIALIDYSRKGFSTFSGYARQNPEFRNRHGGLMGLVASFSGEGGASLGGFDIGTLLKGIEMFFSMTTYNPEFIKGLTIRNIFAKGGEIEIAELSTIPDKLGDLSESVAALNIDPDMDKRKNKLKLNIMMPSISYKPGAKTTLSMEVMNLKAGFDRDVVRGVRKGKDELEIKYQSEFENLGNPASSKNPYISWQDPRSPTGVRYVFLHFDQTGKNEYIEYEYPIGSGNWERKYVNLTRGGYIDLTNPDHLLDIPGNAGQYVLVSSNKLGKLVDKPLELKVSISYPKLTLMHDFSKKLKYKFEYSTMAISFDAGYLDTVDLKGAITDFIKAEKTTTIKNTFNYELFRNISLVLQYNLERRKCYEDVGGHKESKSQVVFEAKVVF